MRKTISTYLPYFTGNISTTLYIVIIIIIVEWFCNVNSFPFHIHILIDLLTIKSISLLCKKPTLWEGKDVKYFHTLLEFFFENSIHVCILYMYNMYLNVMFNLLFSVISQKLSISRILYFLSFVVVCIIRSVRLQFIKFYFCSSKIEKICKYLLWHIYINICGMWY